MRLKPQVHLPHCITNWFPLAIWRMPIDKKVVYLTFDDGPIPEVTPWVLDLLMEHNIKATFFAVGENVFRYPEIFEQIVEDGHAVGNHTYHHLQGLKSDNKTYYKDIVHANKMIGSNLFRPPHGWLKRAQYRYLSGKYKIIMWDVISCDYNRNITKEEVLNNVLEFAREGSIITFHDSLKAESHLKWALPRAIEALKAQGYEFDKIEFPKVRRLVFSPAIQRIRRFRNNLRQLGLRS
jgi:peptidoglycan/xylan/chitin deacetylase (PgdA/CDA1 family)